MEGRKIYVDHTHKQTSRNSHLSAEQGVWPLHYDDCTSYEELFHIRQIFPKDKETMSL